MVTNINHITILVSNVEESFKFYKNILGLDPVIKWGKGAYFTIGDLWFALNQDMNVNTIDRKDYHHIAFSCNEDEFSIMKSKLIDYGSKEWSQNNSEGESFYFTDPDGHRFELHIGDLETRLNSIKNNSSDDVEYF